MNIQDIINTISENKAQLGITLYTPAYISDIEEFERELNIILPEDIKSFYRFCNGFESAEDMFRIIPLKEILEWKAEYQPNQFYIAEYMIYCDMWVIDINKSHNEYTVEAYRDIVLTNSFTEFLHRFLKGGVFAKDGLYEWKDQIVNGQR
jgi:hypothetical protein